MKISDTIGLVLKSKAESKVRTIAPDQSVFEAIQMMAKYDIGALLVLSENRVVGILSERDYARKGFLMGHPSKETQVQQIMTSPVFFVSPQHTVDECMSIMTEHHFRHLPVLAGRDSCGTGLHRRHGQVGHLRPRENHTGTSGLHHRSLPRLVVSATQRVPRK